jgi:hypothetical protein
MSKSKNKDEEKRKGLTLGAQLRMARFSLDRAWWKGLLRVQKGRTQQRRK